MPILVYKICKNYVFEKQSGGAIARFLESCTWRRHSAGGQQKGSKVYCNKNLISLNLH